MVKTVDLDVRRTISKISMKLVENKFLGLRIVDENGDYLVNVTWDTWLDNKWTSYWLEEGQ